MTVAEAALLVVDDNEGNRYTLARRLNREGYTNLTMATNGREALDKLKSQAFDLVLLDIMMPDINGYEVLEQIMATPVLRDIPIIMISALDEVESVIRCIELGAEDYLNKPFNPTLLRARVGASLEKKRLRDEVRRNLERLEEELDSARALQLGMVPTRFPEPTREHPFEIFAMMEPAREVGGDLYDFYQTDNGTLCFLVGDVSEKGVASALFMVRAKNLIRLVTKLMRSENGSIPTPADIIAVVNQDLCQDNAAMMFVTLFFGMLDPRTGDMQFTNAGHNPPYHLTADGIAPITTPKGRPLGTRSNSTYETGRLRLAPGEAIYLYTDGITEAANSKYEFFTEERLEATLRHAAGGRPHDLVRAVAASVRVHADGAPQSDDITAMAIRHIEACSA
jgi:sigma-B regulation protein RsbU (phosphoserine phosphatase)